MLLNTRNSYAPTNKEKENGWDGVKLKAYILERERAANLRIFGDEKNNRVPVSVNSKRFNPHHWQR